MNSFKKFQEMLGVSGYMEAAGDDGAKGGGAGSDEDKGGKAGDDKTGGDDKGGEGGDDKGDDDKTGGDDDGDDDKSGKDKPTDREAKLLKESMKRKEENKTLKSELEKQAEQLKKFDGIDLDQVNQLLAEQKDAETKKLEAKGEWDKLKAQIVDQHKTEVKSLEEKISELNGKIENGSEIINKLTIGHSFDSSPFISDEMTLTPAKARIVYGTHFEIVEGEVVAYDKPKGASERTQLVNGEGNPLDFNEAMKKIVDADPDRDTIIKSKMKQGSDSKPNDGKSKPKVEKQLKGRDRIAAGLTKL